MHALMMRLLEKIGPIPLGEVWNMTYDQNAPEGYLEPVTHEQLWDRYARFINEILPVAEKYGVQMALHPDDPPMPTMRGQARLVYQPDFYKKLKEINPSHANGFELVPWKYPGNVRGRPL